MPILEAPARWLRRAPEAVTGTGPPGLSYQGEPFHAMERGPFRPGQGARLGGSENSASGLAIWSIQIDQISLAHAAGRRECHRRGWNC